MKAAGINVARKGRKKRGVDYNEEIPFEKKPAPGFHDTSQEVFDPSHPDFKNLRQEGLEGERRSDKEAKERQKDKERIKKRKENDMPGAITAQNRAIDVPKKKRSKLVLPSPQVSESELEQIVKAGHASRNARQLSEDAAGPDAPTHSLLSDYQVNK